MSQAGSKGQSLKRSLLTLITECCKLNSRLDAAERDNGHLRADLAQKQTFGDEHLALLIEQLLSDDSKTVARAANALNGLATGNESVSAAIRIKLLADPSALNNIFHVRLPAPFPTPLPQERLTPPLHAFPRRRRPSSRPRRPGGSSSRSAPRSAQVPRRAAPRRAVRPVTRPAARALQAQILLAPRGFSEQSN